MTDKYEDAFHEMRDQMIPSPDLLATLNARLAVDGETAEPQVVDNSAKAHQQRPVAIPLGTRTDPAKPGSAPTGRSPWFGSPSTIRRRGLGIFSGSAIAVVLAGLMLVTGVSSAMPPTLTQGHVAADASPGPVGEIAPPALLGAASYEDIVAVISSPTTSPSAYWSGFAGSRYPTRDTIVYPVELSSEVTGADSAFGDYSGTNTQVAGIDEGDIVKTDGEYLYIAHGRTIKVVKAAGVNSSVVATIDTSTLTTGDDFLVGPVVDMMITDDTLIVEVHGFTDNLSDWPTYSASYLSMEASSLKTAVYSLADPTSPTLLSISTQSGTYSNSRLLNNVLYAISNYFVQAAALDSDDPATYVPVVGDGVTTRPMTPGDVYIMPIIDWPVYTVVTAVDALTGELLSELSVLGRSDTVYMSENNLYLATGNWESTYIDWEQTATDEEDAPEVPVDEATELPSDNPTTMPLPVEEPTIPQGEPTTQPTTEPSTAPTASTTVVMTEVPEPTTEEPGSLPSNNPTSNPTYEITGIGAGETAAPNPKGYTGSTTTLIRIGLAGGHLAVTGEGKVPGTLLNQFALDEWENNLRVVTTRDDTSNEYSWKQIPALWVLDSSMTIVGAIDNLVENESVQSVRFVESQAYVVTYRQIDPLFAIDLSDPAKPKVQSELKIPGFSSYLHPFGEGLLLGIGQETNEYTGVSEGIKVSMFDVADPYDVTQVTSTVLEDIDYVAVAEDHKAAFVDVERGLIGFSVTDYQEFMNSIECADSSDCAYFPVYQYVMKTIVKYLVFSWDSGKFTLVSTVEIQDINPDASLVRGVRVGEDFYVATPENVGVYHLSDFSQLTQVDLG